MPEQESDVVDGEGRPAWLDGIDGKDEPSFFDTRNGRKVHVLAREEPAGLPLLARWVGLCGAQILWPLDNQKGTIYSFPDERLCARCHRAAGEWSDELFNHPTDEESYIDA